MPQLNNDFFSAANAETRYEPPEPHSAPTIDERINQLPNAEKLTPFERGVYRALPGITDSSAGKWIMEKVNAFSETKFGAYVLGGLDVLAEGLERTAGLGVQLANLQPGEEFELRDGWYAGGLLYDVANLPKLKRDANGKVTGISLPTDDLPGSENLADFRQKFAALVEVGVEPGQALVQVREEYYSSLGALAIRAQLQDTFFHVVADPLNLVAGSLKPVQALKAKAFAAMTQKVATSVDELADMEKALRAAGSITEAAKVAEFAAKVQKGEFQTISVLDKAAIWLSRADDFAAPRKGLADWLTKPFQLTPESKAKELASLVHDNISARIIAEYINNPNAPQEIAKAITRASKGSIGGEFGHLAASLQGRTIQGFLGGADAAATDLLSKWEKVSGNRELMRVLAGELGLDDYKFLRQLSDNPASVLKMLSPETIAAHNVTEDFLKGLGKVFDGSPWLHDPQAWAVKVMSDIGDHAMKQAIVQFGVKERGLVTRWSQAVKAAESLAFLRLNPAYGIRNLVNNEITMLSRGVFGLMTPKEIDDFWRTAGFGRDVSLGLGPSRLGEGFANVAEAERSGSVALRKALVPNRGMPEKIEDFFHGIARGKADIVSMSAKMEESASKRATTIGYKQWFQQFWRPTSINNRVGSADIEAMERIQPGLSSLIDNVVKSSNGSSAALDAALKSNFNVAPETVFRALEEAYGVRASEALGVEITDYIAAKLPDAAEKGKLNEFFVQLGKHLDDHNDEVFNSRVQDFIGDYAERFKAGGQPEVARALSDVMDTFWGGHIEHAYRMPTAAADARALGDAGWAQLFLDDAKHFDKVFRRVDNVLEAVERAFPGNASFRKSFGDIKAGWEDFFRLRTDGYAELKGLKDKEWSAAFEALQDKLNDAYAKVIKNENSIYARTDKVMAGMVADPAANAAFQKYRSTLANLRTNMRAAVVEQRRLVRGMDAKEAEAAWAVFWKEQNERYVSAWQTERASILAAQGDPKTVAAASSLPGEVAPMAAQGARQGGAPMVADLDAMYPKQMPLDFGMAELTYRQKGILDKVRKVALEQGKKKPALFKNLPEPLQKKVLAHIEATKTEFGEARYQATRWGLYRRDSSLLNYNRRTNADSWASNVFPFAFWTTNSIQKWAIESIDRPAMLTNYLRMRRLLDTAGLEDPNRPSRLQGKLRIPLPFAPDWMGDAFIDPLRMALPIDSFIQPVEQMFRNNLQVEGRAERLLQAKLEKGQITQSEFDAAVNDKNEMWNAAVAEAVDNDQNLKFDAWDFASLVSSPHAPLQWAYNMASGHPEDIGPFSPLTRIMRNAATAAGVEDYANAPWNLEAKMRRSLGLPIYDKWEDYRIDRALAVLHAEGKYSGSEIQRALAISAELQRGQPREALMQDPAWDVYQKGVSRANQTYTGGVGGAVMGLLGLSVNVYPWGERYQRDLKTEFTKALNAREAGDDDAMIAFFDKNPEYASYLAIFDKPEEKLRKFLVDQTWDKWYSLPTVTKRELTDQLGPQFADGFVNKETRNYNAFTVGDMQLYLKLMGGNPVGVMSAEQDMLAKLFSGQLSLTEPEMAWRAQVFYDTRYRDFPDYYAQQNAYYDPKSKSYKKVSPELKQYWDWRRDFMQKNPDIVPYITEDEKAIAKAKKTQRNPDFAVPTAQELNISGSAQALMQDYFSSGEMPPALEQYLETLAETRGLSVEQVRGMLGL